jgi:hypothetical protein
MRHITGGTVAIVLIVLSVKGVLAQGVPIPITDCETITQPGAYVVENNLVASYTEDCLVISSSHVSVDMNGSAITSACPPSNPGCPPIQSGGIAVHITNGADHVSISHLVVENYSVGISAEADHTSVAGASLNAIAGISLNNASYSTFTDVSYTPADKNYHSPNGPILFLTGGSHNSFSFTIATSDSSGVVNNEPGIVITNSSHNVIEGADISCSAEAEAGPGILLTQESNHNYITNNNVFVLFGNGIEVDLGSDHNVIQNNVVEIEAPPPGSGPPFFALFDQNPDCGSNVWTDNTFGNGEAPGQISASPANCID